MVHDFAVEVVLSPERFRQSQGPAAVTGQAENFNQTFADMIISVWTHDDMKYYTLTFTSSSADGRSTVDKTSRIVTKAPITPTFTGSRASSMSDRRSQHSSAPTSGAPSPLSHTPNFPPQGPPSRSSLASAPSILQKATRLRDAILNAMNLPCYAMWKDESIGVPNEALMKLISDLPQGIASQRDFINHFKAMSGKLTIIFRG